MYSAFFTLFENFYYVFYLVLGVLGYRMITNLDEALEQNKRLVNETFRVTQEYEKTKAELIVLKDKMNSQPVTGNPFYRNVSDTDEFAEKLATAEAALKNSEEMNLKLMRSRKEVEKQLQEMDKHMKENNLKLLTTQGLLKTKEEESASLKFKLALYDNKEGIKQKIDELSSQLMEKDVMIAISYEEIKAKDKMMNDAIQTINKISEERRITFEQSQKLKAQINNNESVQMGTENLQHVIIKKNQEIEQIKMENHRLAEMIFGHERMQANLEEKILNLEHQLETFKAQPMMQSHTNNMQTPQPMMQPNASAAFMTQMVENMNRMQMEIQRLNHQNMHQPRK